MKKNKNLNEAKFYCESCGSEVNKNARFCSKCGKFFSSVRCPKCGRTGKTEEFKHGCPDCGYAVSSGNGNFTNHNQNQNSNISQAYSIKNNYIFNRILNRNKNNNLDSGLPLWIYIICIVLLVILIFCFYSCF